MSTIRIEYNGTYPNLCNGTLVVYVDEKSFTFPPYSLHSGGSAYFDQDWKDRVNNGPWSISDWPADFPADLKTQVLEIVNNEIPWGCCGSCL